MITFTVPSSDIYNIVLITSNPVFQAGFISLYQGGFVADNPCQNIIGGTEGQYFADPNVDVNAFFDQNYRIELPLIAGESYTLMVANGGNGQTFDYDITVISDNGTGVNGGGFSAVTSTPVDIDLFCGDLDLVHVIGSQTYVVDAAGNGICNR